MEDLLVGCFHVEVPGERVLPLGALVGGQAATAGEELAIFWRGATLGLFRIPRNLCRPLDFVWLILRDSQVDSICILQLVFTVHVDLSHWHLLVGILVKGDRDRCCGGLGSFCDDLARQVLKVGVGRFRVHRHFVG